MHLPNANEINYQVGDVVWDLGSLRLPGSKRRGVVRSGPDRTVRHYMVEFDDGQRWCAHDELRPYAAVDQLADLLCCGFCKKRPADCVCAKFGYCAVASTGDGLGGTIAVTGDVASTDPISQLGDLVRTPDRRRLSSRERASRRSRLRTAKVARRRNRR